MFTRNDRGIRIAVDQDDGIRAMPTELCRRADTRPREHSIRGNDIRDNRVGIELINADRTLVAGNLLCRTVEANLRQDDAWDTVAVNNLGTAGAYL